MTRYRRGRAYLVYECPKHARNEPLDCRVYAYAALCGLTGLGLKLNREAAKAERPAPDRAALDRAAAPAASDAGEPSRRRNDFLGGGSIW